MTRNTFRVFTAAAVLSLCASTAAANSHSTINAQDTARQLQDLRSDKRLLASKLDELASMARNQHLVSWQSKAGVFDEVRDIINRSGRTLRGLEANLDAMPAAKRAAVETLITELSAMAPEVNSLMKELRENQLVARHPAYATRIIALSNRAIEARRSTDRLVQTALNASAGSQTGD